MKRVFVDSDVILDVLAQRESFYSHSSRLLSLCEKKKIQGYTTALVFANIYYLLSKLRSKEVARMSLRDLRIILEVIPLEDKHVDRALYSKFADFEDALQHFSAEDQGIMRIITRNISDFKHSSIPVSTPQEFLDIYKVSG